MNEILVLVQRNIKVYLRDKAAVFFSFLSVIILLAIYILFLGNLYASGIEGFTQGQIDFMKYAQMMPGLLVLNTITVSTGNLGTLIDDLNKRYLDGFLVTPVKRGKVVLAYYLSSLMITIVFTILMWCLAALLIGSTTGIWYQTDVFFSVLGLSILFAFISASFMVFITTFINSVNAFGAFAGIFGSLIGFATGIYMPLSVFPDVMVKIASAIPFTHFVIILRTLTMKQPVALLESMGAEAADIDTLLREFGAKEIGVFGMDVPMVIIIGISFIIAAGLLVFATIRMNHKIKK